MQEVEFLESTSCICLFDKCMVNGVLKKTGNTKERLYMGSGLCSGDRSVWKLSGWLSAWCRDMPELCLLEPWRNGGECFGKDKNEVPEGISYYPQLHWYGWDDGSVWRWEKAIQNSSSSQNRISINSSGMSPKSGEIESRLMLRTSAIFLKFPVWESGHSFRIE